MRILRAQSRFSALALSAMLSLWGCSSTQQQGEEGELEASEENAENGEYENGNAEEVAEGDGGEGYGNEENMASEENVLNEELPQDEGYAAEGEGSDIQELIANANQGEEMAGDGYNSSMAAPARTNSAPMNTTASVPMNNSQRVREVSQSAGMMERGSAGSMAPALPEVGSKMPYIVQRGDTLAKVAAKIYGNPSRWSEIAELSSLANPSRIYPGDVVYYQLTQETSQFAQAYEMLPRREVVVNQGDTLASIAARTLGNASDWKAIWRQNDIIDNPDSLSAGMVLYYVDTGAMTASINPNSKQESLASTSIEFQMNEGSVTVVDNTSNQSFNGISEIIGTAIAQLSALS